MHITVDRFYKTDNASLSKLSVDNQFVCFGLEDEPRADKVAGETRIPAGKYKVALRTVGGFTQRYQAKFGDFHHGMLWVQDVPGFEYILIHIGNTEEDTAGCLLVGKTADKEKMFIGNSTAAYKELYAMVWEAARDGNLTIEYIDNDR